MRRKILSILVSGFFVALTHLASAQTNEQLIADVDLGQKEAEVNATFRRLFQ